MAVVVLVAGYALALSALAQIRRVFAERRSRWFVALEVGLAGIAVGWWLRGQPIGVVINGLAFVALGLAWSITGRRRPY